MRIRKRTVALVLVLGVAATCKGDGGAGAVLGPLAFYGTLNGADYYYSSKAFRTGHAHEGDPFERSIGLGPGLALKTALQVSADRWLAGKKNHAPLWVYRIGSAALSTWAALHARAIR